MFGNPHDADLSRHGRTGTRRHHQCGQDRAQFPDHTQRHDGAQDPFRPELPERVVDLQAQHHPGERGGQDHNERGLEADEMKLFEDLKGAKGRPRQPGEGGQHKEEHPPHLCDQKQGCATDPCKAPGQHAQAGGFALFKIIQKPPPKPGHPLGRQRGLRAESVQCDQGGGPSEARESPARPPGRAQPQVEVKREIFIEQVGDRANDREGDVPLERRGPHGGALHIKADCAGARRDFTLVLCTPDDARDGHEPAGSRGEACCRRSTDRRSGQVLGTGNDAAGGRRIGCRLIHDDIRADQQLADIGGRERTREPA